MGEELHYRLKVQRIKFEEVDYYVIESRKSNLSIKDIQEFLSKPPFSLLNQEKSYAIGKYFVEFNDQRMQKRETNDIKVVTNLLK